ncbi:MAG: hypothetical protein EOO81_07940 [Oxalobacteraceae bacterium]|nr:MAG: hypothetical protein EOO81_07940 [Oxalobacteraceae bacterium]
MPGFCEGGFHFLDGEELGEALEATLGGTGIGLVGELARGALAGALAVEVDAGVIAQGFTLGMDAAALVGGEEVAWRTGGLVVAKAVGAAKGKGRAAKGKAGSAIGTKIGIAHEAQDGGIEEAAVALAGFQGGLEGAAALG